MHSVYLFVLLEHLGDRLRGFTLLTEPQSHGLAVLEDVEGGLRAAEAEEPATGGANRKQARERAKRRAASKRENRQAEQQGDSRQGMVDVKG